MTIGFKTKRTIKMIDKIIINLGWFAAGFGTSLFVVLTILSYCGVQLK